VLPGFLPRSHPLSAPGIIATAIYSFITAWNEYVYALTFLNDDDKLTLPVGLQRFFTEYATNWPGLMGASLISVPVVALFLVLQKYFVRALTEGAVKS
jgi:multiple sugar transport system permease protein